MQKSFVQMDVSYRKLKQESFCQRNSIEKDLILVSNWFTLLDRYS